MWFRPNFFDISKTKRTSLRRLCSQVLLLLIGQPAAHVGVLYSHIAGYRIDTSFALGLAATNFASASQYYALMVASGR